MAERMNWFLTPNLGLRLYVGLEHIAMFDVFVVSGSSSLYHIVETGVRLDVNDCAEIVGKRKWVFRCVSVGWLLLRKLFASSPVAVDNGTSF